MVELAWKDISESFVFGDLNLKFFYSLNTEMGFNLCWNSENNHHLSIFKM